MLVALAAGLVALIGYAILLSAQKAVWVKRRLEPHIAPDRVKKRKREGAATVATVIRATERALGNMRQFRWLSRLLERADLPVRAAEFAYIMLGCGFALGLLAGVATGSVLPFFLGLLIGCALPLGFVPHEGAPSPGGVRRQLPDLLVTMAASLKAGHSFRQGIQSVVDEGMEPAAASSSACSPTPSSAGRWRTRSSRWPIASARRTSRS